MISKVVIGKNIKKFRVINDLTQEQLGKKVDLTYEMISRIENGKVNFSIDKLLKIVETLHIPPEDLFVANPKSLFLNFTLSEKDIYTFRKLLGRAEYLLQIKKQE